MADLTVIGSGISGLLSAYLFNGNVEVLDEIRNLEKLNSKASLWTIIPPLCGNYAKQCEEAISFYESLGSKYNIFYKKTITLTDKELNNALVSEEETNELEPYLKINCSLRKIENSFFIEGDDLISRLVSEFHVKMGTKVVKLEVDNDEVKYVLTGKGEKIKVDRLLITAGYWSQDLVPLKLSPLKGHLIIVKTNYNLNNIIFYRGKIIVKGKKGLFIDGDSIKSSSREIDYDTVKENITIASQLFSFSTSDLKIRVGVRSVSENSDPIVKKIYKNAVVITGFRFGFALAPYLVREALKIIEGV